MPVYVDDSIWPFRNQLYCHMLADSLEELHAMADKIGMRREWFQCLPKASTPHYDLSPSRRAMAVRFGAIEVDRYQMSEINKKAKLYWLEHQKEIKENTTIDNSQPIVINLPSAILAIPAKPFKAFTFKTK